VTRNAETKPRMGRTAALQTRVELAGL